MAKNIEKSELNEEITKTNLVGYVRRNNAGGAVKVSINTDAFEDCKTYLTSDGQEFVPLITSLNSLNKVLIGEKLLLL